MTSPSILSPRAARTRAALIGAGFDLLAQRPIDAIAIDEVVACAGVAKGSFFNHFADKQAFAEAIATEVRLELEEQVSLANGGIPDPVDRIAGGMRVVARFALTRPKRTVVLLRSHANSTVHAHPLNRGVVTDFKEASALGLLRPEAATSGVLYWMGLCQILMIHIVETGADEAAAMQRLSDLLVLGLVGLGLDAARAAGLAERMQRKA